jgi:hypothetical protein
MRLESPSISNETVADFPVASVDHAPTFHLDGPTRALDRRVNAFRADIADISLAGTLFAPHYAAPMLRNCSASSVMMRSAPADTSEAVSQLLAGEGFALLDILGDWAWGYSVHDHYVGYVEAAALGVRFIPTHRVIARTALVFAGNSIKAPMIARLPFGALISGDEQEAFLATDAGFVHGRHVCGVEHRVSDPVTIAELLIGMPYLWGGRGAGGIDCSGLVQVALAAAGIPCPRDTDQIRTQCGRDIPEDATLRRGDIISFPGHVGLMVDGERLIHANAHWMAVTIEPLADVVARLAPNHDRPILARRRL